MGERREFENTFEEYRGEVLHDPHTGRLAQPHYDQVVAATIKLLPTFDEGVVSEAGSGHTVYTGLAGIAITYLKLYDVLADDRYLAQASNIIARARRKEKKKHSPSFMAGDCGPEAVAAVVYGRDGKDLSKAWDMVSQYLCQCEAVCGGGGEVEDEVLFGRAGYLLGMLYMKHHLGDACVDDSYLQQVAHSLLASGKKRSSTMRHAPPLMYEWHGKAYLGAAHGLCGILYMLLKIKRLLDASTLTDLIKPTVDWLLSLQFPSGNFPSSIGSDTDRLVHWCHGAPGFCSLLLEAYRVFGDDKYLLAARRCGDVVWRRGLLRKGYGLCHGAAGNGYVFLQLYQATSEERYLYQAVKFAEWCCEYGRHGCRTPDRPFSLYEGMAGTIYFLCDILHPQQAALPAYGFC